MSDELRIEPKTLAHLIQSQYADMLDAAEAVGAERAEWMPMGKGRSVMSQLRETAERAALLIDLVDGRPYRPSPSTDELAAIYPTFESVVAANRAKSTELADKVGKLTEADLLEVTEYAFGDRSLGRLLVGVYWNASYHEGQITYIHTLLA